MTSEKALLPEDEHFEISFSLNASDRASFKREFVSRRDDPWPAVLAIAAALVGGIAIYFVCGWLEVAARSSELVAIAPAVAVLVWVLVSGRSRRKGAAALLNPDSSHVRTVGEGLDVTLGKPVFVPWTAMTELVITDAAIYLEIEKRLALMAPRRAFDDRTDFYVFASVVAKYARL